MAWLILLAANLGIYIIVSYAMTKGIAIALLSQEWDGYARLYWLYLGSIGSQILLAFIGAWLEPRSMRVVLILCVAAWASAIVAGLYALVVTGWGLLIFDLSTSIACVLTVVVSVLPGVVGILHYRTLLSARNRRQIVLRLLVVSASALVVASSVVPFGRWLLPILFSSF